MVLACFVFKSAGVVVFEQRVNLLKISFEVGYEYRPMQNRIRNRLGDLRFAAAGDGARFVAEGALSDSTDEPPRAIRGGFLQVNLVSRGPDIGAPGEQFDFLFRTIAGPGNALKVQVEMSVLRHVDDVGK